jgi:hypothetical protein
MSIGGSRSNSALRDGAALQNSIRSSSAPRRRSFSISSPATPLQDYSAYGKDSSGKSDRRALLDEWRRQRGEPSIAAEDVVTSNKRPKLQQHQQQREAVLPRSGGTYGTSSSSSTVFIAAAETSLERYRLKKLQKLQQSSVAEESSFPPRPTANRSFAHDDDETASESNRGVSSLFSAGTPSAGRRLGAARRRSFSTNNLSLSFLSHSPMTQETEGKFSFHYLWPG